MKKRILLFSLLLSLSTLANPLDKVTDAISEQKPFSIFSDGSGAWFYQPEVSETSDCLLVFRDGIRMMTRYDKFYRYEKSHQIDFRYVEKVSFKEQRNPDYYEIHFQTRWPRILHFDGEIEHDGKVRAVENSMTEFDAIKFTDRKVAENIFQIVIKELEFCHE